eukprot:874633-Pyramimonas_sp.AAC.1
MLSFVCHLYPPLCRVGAPLFERSDLQRIALRYVPTVNPFRLVPAAVCLSYLPVHQILDVGVALAVLNQALTDCPSDVIDSFVSCSLTAFGGR